MMNSMWNDLFISLPDLREHHAPNERVYQLIKGVVRREVEKDFSDSEAVSREFMPFGNLAFPFFQMGTVSSLNLFDIDELIIFSFYWANRDRYKKVVDIGANIGLHSIILSKCGYEVKSFEPDPFHYRQLRNNLVLNGCDNVETHQAAVSGKNGECEFVRVLGNTTGSHIAGSKENPYGDLERFTVKVTGAGPLVEWADLVKIDAEGHEKEILGATTREHWMTTDALVEVGSPQNAKWIFSFFKEANVNLFSQKMNWKKVVELSDVPINHLEGTLFISCKDEVPWG